MKGTVKRLMEKWQHPTSDFFKREFVISTAEQYPQQVKFTAVKDKCEKLEGIKEGDLVEVKFDVRGREWNDKYFVDLNAWDIKKMDAEVGAPAGDQGQPATATAGPSVPPAQDTYATPATPAADSDDLPF